LKIRKSRDRGLNGAGIEVDLGQFIAKSQILAYAKNTSSLIVSKIGGRWAAWDGSSLQEGYVRNPYESPSFVPRDIYDNVLVYPALNQIGLTGAEMYVRFYFDGGSLKVVFGFAG